MGKNHLKRLDSPKRWKIKRKGYKYIIRPLPGPHTKEGSVPLNVVMRDLLGYCTTTREVKHTLHNKNLLVNGKRRKETKFPIGLFDVIELKETKEFFRVVFDKKGKIDLIAIDTSDAEIRPCKIMDKGKIKGKTQLRLFDGSNIILEKDDYKTGDTVVLSVPKNEVKKRLKFDKKSLIYLIGGKHVGEVGVIENIRANKVTYKLKDSTFETLKEFAFVIGEDKPVIKISK